MFGQRKKTSPRRIVEQLSHDRLVAGTYAGAALYLPGDTINAAAHRSQLVAGAIETGKTLRRLWSGWLAAFDDDRPAADWSGPKRDVVDRLDGAKFEVQKQVGYF